MVGMLGKPRASLRPTVVVPNIYWPEVWARAAVRRGAARVQCRVQSAEGEGILRVRPPLPPPPLPVAHPTTSHADKARVRPRRRAARRPVTQSSSESEWSLTSVR